MTNKNDLVVLGLLCEQDRCGYEIIREVKRRDFEHWANINPASIYNCLARLEKSGALSCHADKVGNYPERKVYSVTQKGRRRLSDMVIEAVSSVSHADHAIACLGIGFVYCVEEKAALRAIRSRIAALEMSIEHLVEKDNGERQKIPLNWLLLLEEGEAHVKAQLNMLHRLAEAIESSLLAKDIERIVSSQK